MIWSVATGAADSKGHLAHFSVNLKRAKHPCFPFDLSFSYLRSAVESARNTHHCQQRAATPNQQVQILKKCAKLPLQSARGCLTQGGGIHGEALRAEHGTISG